MVWYSHVLKNFPHFVVIHTVQGFNVISKAEVDVFLDFSCSFYDLMEVGIVEKALSKHTVIVTCSL